MNEKIDLKASGEVKSGKIVGLTEEQEQIALSLASEGRTAKYIRDIILCSQHKFRAHCERCPTFAMAFIRARQEGLEEIADSLQTMADDEKDVLRARLKSENLRWILSKRKPHVYGDRIEVNLNQNIDIGQALTDARNRALPDVITTAVSGSITPAISVAADDEANTLDDLLS